MGEGIERMNQKPLRLFVAAVLLTLVSCVQVTSPPRLVAPEVELLPGEGMRFEPPPVGTPEVDPKLLLRIAPRDAVTRQRVTVPVTVLLGGRVLGAGLSAYTFELPGVLAQPTELAVEAQGYERWSLVLRYKLTNTRTWEVPVWLKLLSVVPAEVRLLVYD